MLLVVLQPFAFKLGVSLSHFISDSSYQPCEVSLLSAFYRRGQGEVKRLAGSGMVQGQLGVGEGVQHEGSAPCPRGCSNGFAAGSATMNFTFSAELLESVLTALFPEGEIQVRTTVLLPDCWVLELTRPLRRLLPLFPAQMLTSQIPPLSSNLPEEPTHVAKPTGLDLE